MIAKRANTLRDGIGIEVQIGFARLEGTMEESDLTRELKLAKTQKQRLAALQAIGTVEGQISSLEQQMASKKKKRTDTAKANYQKHVDAEERRLKLNLARAVVVKEANGQQRHTLSPLQVAIPDRAQKEIEVR